VVAPAKGSDARSVWTWRAADGGCGRRAYALGPVVGASACRWVRRADATETMAVGARVLALEEECAAARTRSAVAAAAKAAGAGQRRPENACHQLSAAGPAHPATAGSARQRQHQGRRVAARTDRRRPGCALARARTQTSWGVPPRRRPKTGAAQDVRDRRVRDADSESLQLTLDAHVAPPWGSLSRVIRLRDSAASGGRPSLRGRCRRFPCSSARCQRRSVCGLNAKQDHRSGGSRRLAAASKARSAVV
jgi:hypothetical protein